MIFLLYNYFEKKKITKYKKKYNIILFYSIDRVKIIQFSKFIERKIVFVSFI